MDQATFDSTIDDRYFEDYVPGSTYEYGALHVDEAQIVEFARAYDPQYVHTDPQAAADGPFGGLIASGWQTAGLMMRLYVDHYLSRVASLGAGGVEELRWPVPGRPGDTLTLRVSVIDGVPSRTRPDRGVVRTLAELINQHGDIAFRTVVPNILRRRPAHP